MYNYLIECLGGMSTTIEKAEDIDFDMTATSIVLNNDKKKEKTIINMKNVVRIIRKEVEDE